MSYDPRLPLPNSGITDPADKLYFLDSHFQRTWLRLTELFTDSHNRLQRLENKRNLTAQATPGGTLADVTADVLQTYTLPANAVRVGQRLRIKAFGRFQANAHVKTAWILFDGNIVATTNAGAYNNFGWVLEVDVAVQTSTLQRCLGLACVGSASESQLNTITADLSTALLIKVMGQNGTATVDDVVSYSFVVSVD